MNHDQGTQSTMNRWRHEHAGGGGADQISASGRSRAQELTSGDEKERGEHGELILSLTRARVVVWPPSNGGKMVVEVELIGGGARAQRGGKEGGGRCGEV
jgi:hypothetical protein